MLLGATPKHRNTEATLLHAIQRESFGYFLRETNPANGLVVDKTCVDWPAGIAAVGLALAAYPVGVERAFLERDEALRRTLVTLRFFAQSPQGPEPNATGYKGFYYHFLDMKTGERAWQRRDLSRARTERHTTPFERRVGAPTPNDGPWWSWFALR